MAEGGNRSKVQILINQQHREGEVRYLTGLISQSKSARFRPYATKNKHRGIEQLAARVAHNHKVGGSNPPSATLF